MKKIIISNKYECLLDDDDFSRVSLYKWNIKKITPNNIYATTKINNKHVLMHRFITGVKSGLEIDHINGNGLDNRQVNLRVCTHAQNMMNRRLNKDNKSGYRGIYWSKEKNKWVVQLRKNGKRIIFKAFNKLKDAIMVRDYFSSIQGEFVNAHT